MEEEPSSDADDDYEEPPAPRGQLSERARADQAEQERAADVAAEHGVPTRRPVRRAAVAANTAMDALQAEGMLC